MSETDEVGEIMIKTALLIEERAKTQCPFRHILISKENHTIDIVPERREDGVWYHAIDDTHAIRCQAQDALNAYVSALEELPDAEGEE